MLVEFECPKCKGHIYEKWGLNGSNASIRFSYLHWLLNPGLAVNELCFGQRLPETTYLCKSCELPIGERSYIHCPSCNTFHSGLIWSNKNAFGNWLGYVCPSCGGQIPCLWNLTSRVVLALTSPIWWLPVKANKTRWLAARRQHLSLATDKVIERKPVNYIRMGLIWGGAMFFLFTLFFPLLMLYAFGKLTWASYGSSILTVGAFGLAVWPLSGLAFGIVMQKLLEAKGDTNLHLTVESKREEDI